MSKRTLLASVAASTVATLAWTPAVNAQCTVTPPPGAIEQNDACGSSEAGYQDPNGGCNYTGNPTQALGTLTPSSSTVVCYGTIGNFIPSGSTTPSSRDLDWYSFELTQPGTVNFSITNNDSSGTSVPIVVFVAEGFDCETQEFIVGVETTLCPYTVSVTLPEGVHKLVLTVPFEGDGGALCSVDYRATVTYTPGVFPECGLAKGGSCIETHPSGGCDNFACCEAVCAFEPACCAVEWDQICVDLALSEELGCGYFVYTCDPPTGAPANDCATSATVAEVGDAFDFSNVNASTDGPNGDSSICAAGVGNDLWWKVQSPGTGYLTATLCAGTTFDTVIDVYSIGTSGNFDPELLPEYQIGCADDTCGTVGGPSIVTIIDAEAGDWFLFRVGGWIDPATGVAATGSGTLTFEFLNVIYNTGGSRPVIFNGALTNLGLSSGWLSAASPKRWLATPFTVPAPPTGDKWLVQEIAANGFSPAGVLNETLNWIIWNRNAATNARPVDGDQVVSGSVPFPAPIDDPTGNPATEQHDITTDFELEPGDYFLTVYAGNSTTGGSTPTPANFAWFCNPPNGIVMTDAQGAYLWRSANFPTPGFIRTTPAWQPDPAQTDPNSITTVAFKMLGVPLEGEVIPGDLNGDGIVNGADLTILLGCWGTVTTPACAPADLNADGNVNGTDLTVLLGNWTS